MSSDETLLLYTEQLEQVKLALSITNDENEKQGLIALKVDLEQIIELTQDNNEQSSRESIENGGKEIDSFDDEYALFIAEIAEENTNNEINANVSPQERTTNRDLSKDLNSLEGSKCKAPHTHTWGEDIYHNALISSVLPNYGSYDNIEVKIIFTHPTHTEMRTCPYMLESLCKFSDDKCRYSHGKIVKFSSLEEFIEPNYADLDVGSLVLAKRQDELWYRATIKRIFKEKCCVKFDTDSKELEVEFINLMPLDCTENLDEQSDENNSDLEEYNVEDIINNSLLVAPPSDRLGNWEEHTKGIGSKLMQKMGYIFGTGLGKNAEGRVEPVSAIVLPPGKSLDYCMNLREKHGGSKNLFSVERQLKKLKRKQLRAEKHREHQEAGKKSKTNVFNFINDRLGGIANSKSAETLSKTEHRKQLKDETSRNLNVESLKIDESIQGIHKDIIRIKQGLDRHKDVNSRMYKQLVGQLKFRESELNTLNDRAMNIKNEQNLRSDKRKLTIF